MKKDSPATTRQPQPPIIPGAVYSLDEFRRITKLGQHALRTARKRGLKIYRCGGRGFIIADSWIQFLQDTNGEGDTK